MDLMTSLFGDSGNTKTVTSQADIDDDLSSIAALEERVKQLEAARSENMHRDRHGRAGHDHHHAHFDHVRMKPEDTDLQVIIACVLCFAK